MQQQTTSPFIILKPFLSFMLIFWVLGFTLWIMYGYEESFLIINRLHTPFLDTIMPHLTHLGDGALISGIFGIVLFRKNPALVINLILGMFCLIFIIGFAKQQMFPGWHRPPVVFEGREIIHYITRHGERRNSFPSGHSATVALLMTMAAFYYHKRTALIWALLTVVGCYTRSYIGVHFLGDIVVGSLIGVVLGIGLLTYTYPKLQNWVSRLSEKRRKFWEYFLLINGIIAVLTSIIRLYPSLIS